MHPFRFGTNIRDAADVAGFSRWAEDAGYDSLLLPDHLGVRLSPFATLAAVAAVTERVRVGTYVLNVPFWNPAMLAREVATLDVLSGGRVEVGLGAGHMKSEFDMAGIPWEPFDERCARVESFVGDLDRLLAEAVGDDEAGSADEAAGDDGAPRRPPVMIGSSSDRLIRLAVRSADILAHTGLRQRRGAKLGTFRVMSDDEYDERTGFVRAEAEAAGRSFDDVEHAVLLQHVEVTDDRAGALRRLAEKFGDAGRAEELGRTPLIAVGTATQIVDQLLASRERHGFTYLTTHNPSAKELARLIPALRDADPARG